MLLKNSVAFKSLYVFVLSVVMHTTQANVSNGDFSAGGTDWDTFVYGDPFVTPTATSDPTVDFSTGAAVLTTGEGYGNEAVICQGATSCDVFGASLSPFLIDSNALTLEFDVAFLTVGSDISETGFSPFMDALNVQLWSSVDSAFDIALFVESSGRVSLDLTDFAGTSAALFLRLLDEDDGFNTQVTIDNVEVIKSPVVAASETTTLLLLLSGLFVLGFTNKISKNS